jgi:hypothetical protein
MFGLFKKPPPPAVPRPPSKIPLIRGKMLVQACHDPEQMAKMPKGYKLIAIQAVLSVPETIPCVANGQMSDIIGTYAATGGSFSFPVLQLHMVASVNILETVKGKQLGEAFGLPLWNF